MNVPLPLTVLRGPSHAIVFSNRAQVQQNVERIHVGKYFADAFPELASHFVPILDRVYRDGVSRQENELKIGERFLNCSCWPFRGERGEVEGVIISTLDVTAVVNGRTSAENQGKWLEFVLDLIPIPTILVQPGTADILLINAAGKRQLNSYPTDSKEVSESDCYFSDLSGRRLTQQEWPRFRAARGEDLYGLQLVWNAPGVKTPLVIDSRRLPQAYGHPAVIAIHYHDVTELKLAESALRESVSELQCEREIRERFVTTLTHDLRNPLAAAKLNAQMIARDHPDLKPVVTLANRICGNLARADRMVRDLLDANRLKAGSSFPLRIGNHCLNDIAQSCIDGLGVIHGDRFRLEAPAQIRGRWCRSSLKRIFENLCGNAAKYGKPGTPVLVSLLTLDEDKVNISVHNHGNPIPREEQPGLFQPYHRTKSAQIGHQRGWGLGLALVRGIAEAHGGSVTLDYSDGEGTRFSVQLPRITVVDQERTAQR